MIKKVHFNVFSDIQKSDVLLKSIIGISIALVMLMLHPDQCVGTVHLYFSFASTLLKNPFNNALTFN